jgi:hypothetical protein
MKRKRSKDKGWRAVRRGTKEPHFVDHNIMKTDPKREQFEPTDESPVRTHHHMAGMS